jgi:Phage integrase, N-terminal SAM-like domain
MDSTRSGRMAVTARSQPVAAGGPKLLERVRQAIRAKHYSRRTESAYVDWIRRYIVFHQKRHPSDMGASEIAAFLTWLATERRVSRRNAWNSV